MPGPLDEPFYDLVEARFRRILARYPANATFLGIHDFDETLGDGTRDGVLAEIAEEREHLRVITAMDASLLSSEARFERDLETFLVRRTLFDLERHRVWERRSSAIEMIGDALFGLFARDFAPLPERLAAMTARIEDVPRILAEHRTRPDGRPQVATWQGLELESGEDVPTMFDEVLVTARSELPETGIRRLERAVERGKAAIEEHAAWVRGSLAGAVDDWSLGPDLFDELVELREFDGLDAVTIEAIGHEELAHHEEARRACARELDPERDEADVIEAIAHDHPASFAEALAGYRRAIGAAREFVERHRLVTMPPNERLLVVETPEYMRNVLPSAAYFYPSRFDRDSPGIYVVTPSVGDDPRAMEQHNWPAITNTSIHEAYPGHHLQMSVAALHPSLTRIQVDAPEFVEGWAMYCEQMMREQGYETAPPSRIAMHGDAIFRAARIILDVRMHRDGMPVDEAVAFLRSQTGFSEPVARAEVRRYTYTPTYQMSYLLGKVLLLRLRDAERGRLGEAFDLRAFHDRLMANGPLPISFHRRTFEDAPGPEPLLAAGR